MHSNIWLLVITFISSKLINRLSPIQATVALILIFAISTIVCMW